MSETTKPPFRFWSFFFSLKGRVSRLGVWRFVVPAHLTITFASVAVSLLAKINPDPLATPTSLLNSPLFMAQTAIGLAALILLWPMFAVSFKRLHDIRLTGLIALPYMTPIALGVAGFIIAASGQYQVARYFQWMKLAAELYLWLLTLVLAILPGTPDPNRYGPDPLKLEKVQDVF